MKLSMCSPGQLAASLVLAAVVVGCDRSGPPSGGPAPAFDYAEGSSGCGQCVVFRPNATKTEAIVIHVDADKIGLKEGVMTFDLATPRDGVSVTVEVYPRPQKTLHHCQDFTDRDADPPVVWTAVGGKLTVERLPPEKKTTARPRSGSRGRWTGPSSATRGAGRPIAPTRSRSTRWSAGSRADSTGLRT